MAHQSLEILKLAVREATKQVAIGSIHVHYKHPEIPYRVMGFSILEATDEVAVRYAYIDDLTIEFVRPLVSWLEQVEYDGQMVNRFTKLD